MILPLEEPPTSRKDTASSSLTGVLIVYGQTMSNFSENLFFDAGKTTGQGFYL